MAIAVSLLLMVGSAVARAVVVVNNNYPPTIIATVDPAMYVLSSSPKSFTVLKQKDTRVVCVR